MPNDNTIPTKYRDFKNLADSYNTLRNMDRSERTDIYQNAKDRLKTSTVAADNCLRDIVESLRKQKQATDRWADAKHHLRTEPWKSLCAILRKRRILTISANLISANNLNQSRRDALNEGDQSELVCETVIADIANQLRNMIYIERSLSKLALKRRISSEKVFVRSWINKMTLDRNKWMITGVVALIATTLKLISDFIYYSYFDLGLLPHLVSDSLSTNALNQVILLVIVVSLVFFAVLVLLMKFIGRVVIASLVWRTCRALWNWNRKTSGIIRNVRKSRNRLRTYIQRDIAAFNPPNIPQKYNDNYASTLGEQIDGIHRDFVGCRSFVSRGGRRTLRFLYWGGAIFFTLFLLAIEKSYEAHQVLAGDTKMLIVTSNPILPVYKDVSKIGFSESYLFVTRAVDNTRDTLSASSFLKLVLVHGFELLGTFFNDDDGTDDREISVGIITRDNIVCMESLPEDRGICDVPTPTDNDDGPSSCVGCSPHSEFPDISVLERSVGTVVLQLRYGMELVSEIESILRGLAADLIIPVQSGRAEQLTRSEISRIVSQHCGGRFRILDPILFRRDESSVTYDPEALSRAFDELRWLDFDLLYVVGFASADGSEFYNDSLADDRSQFVIDYLQDREDSVGSILQLDELGNVDLGGENHPMQGIANSRSVWIVACNEVY